MTRAEILAIAKPILFNTEMVKAVLDNRKTVTRRVIKPHNKIKATKLEYTQGNGLWVEDGYIKDYSVSPCWVKIEDYIKNIYKYQVGDYLYVRETWNSILLHDKNDKFYVFKSTYDYNNKNEMKWRPSTHMPKEATRIFLRVTDIRVERLQDMNGNNLEKEGIKTGITHFKSQFNNFGNADRYDIAIEKFSLIWNSTIKKQDLDRYGWSTNPWVWVIEFEKVGTDG